MNSRVRFFFQVRSWLRCRVWSLERAPSRVTCSTKKTECPLRCSSRVVHCNVCCVLKSSATKVVQYNTVQYTTTCGELCLPPDARSLEFRCRGLSQVSCTAALLMAQGSRVRRVHIRVLVSQEWIEDGCAVCWVFLLNLHVKSVRIMVECIKFADWTVQRNLLYKSNAK